MDKNESRTLKTRDKLYIKHILDAINEIEGYLVGVDYKKFLTNKLIQDVE